MPVRMCILSHRDHGVVVSGENQRMTGWMRQVQNHAGEATKKANTGP